MTRSCFELPFTTFLSFTKNGLSLFTLTYNSIQYHVAGMLQCQEICLFYPLLHDNAFEVFVNIMENGAFAPGANASFSIIFSKVFKILLEVFLIFFNVV